MATVKVRLGEFDAGGTDGGDSAKLYRHIHVLDPWGFTHDILVDINSDPRQQAIDYLRGLTVPTEYTV